MNDIDIVTNTILISNDLDFAKDEVLQKISDSIVKLYIKDEFLTEDAKNITKEAYIKENRTKYIVISAYSFNIYAQNSLLKILEESPDNVVFIIISNSKSNFLPTIRSRLKMINISKKTAREPIAINLSKMSLNDIFLFIKNHKRLSKNELKNLIQDIFYEAIHTHSMILCEKELKMFENTLQLADLNSRAEFLLSSLLLAIYNKEK